MIGTWRGALILTKHELSRSLKSYILVLFFLVYLIFFLLPMLKSILEGEKHIALEWAVDFLFYTMLPTIGLLCGKLQLQYWKSDPYSKKMAIWRTMPISSKQIALARYLQVLFGAVVTQVPLFTAFYIMIHYSSIQLPISAFIVFSLTWFSISLIITYLIIYLELGFTGKMYSVIYSLFMVVVMGFTMLYVALFRVSMVKLSINTISNVNYWPAVIAAAAATLVYVFGLKALISRLNKREYIG